MPRQNRRQGVVLREAWCGKTEARLALTYRLVDETCRSLARAAECLRVSLEVLSLEGAKVRFPIGYRAYVIGPDGHIRDRIDLFCLDDAAAKIRTAELVTDDVIELWQEARRVSVFEPSKQVAAPVVKL